MHGGIALNNKLLPLTNYAVFLDLDGTLIEDKEHISSHLEIQFFRDAILSLRFLQNYFTLFIVTNRSGIAKGFITHEQVEVINQSLISQFTEYGIHIQQVYYCPYERSEGCKRIKPNPYFLDVAVSDYSIDLHGSFVIGDHPHNIEFALNAGANGIYVLTGHGQEHRDELPSGSVLVNSIWDAGLLACRTAFSRMHERDIDVELKLATEIIRNGCVVAFPTETVYGLGANAYDGRAVARIYEIKKRPSFDPLIVHICHPDNMKSVVSELPSIARDLIVRFFPGPLTLVLPKSPDIPDIVTAGLSTVAVRMPAHPLALELIRMSDVPLAAPSANLFGRTSPTTAEHVRKQLGNDVDMVLDGGHCFVGLESTVVSLISHPPVLLRAGGVPMEEIEKVVGELVIPSEYETMRPSAPGQLRHHYATQTPLILYDAMKELPENVRAGLLAFRSFNKPSRFEVVEVLSPNGNLREAAVNFFSALHRLDDMGLDIIVAEMVPNKGLGIAINDRLMRASQIC